MMAGNEEEVMATREEAHDLAIMLNGGAFLGILGGPDAPGCVLERETAAAEGTIPLLGDRRFPDQGRPHACQNRDGLYIRHRRQPWVLAELRGPRR